MEENNEYIIDEEREDFEDTVFNITKELEKYCEENMLPLFNAHGKYINYHDLETLIYNERKGDMAV